MDVFEASYAYVAAEKGSAVVFPIGQRSGGCENDLSEFKDKESCPFETNPFEIDLNDKK